MATITVNTSITYQTLDPDPWEAASQAGQSGQVPSSDGSTKWDVYKSYLMDQAVNDLGLCSFRVESKAAAGGGSLTTSIIDNTLATTAAEFRSALAAAGKPWRFHLCHTGKGGAGAALHVPATFASAYLAEWQRLEAGGNLPYDFEWLEPDNSSSGFYAGSATNFANCMDALGDALVGAGYTPRFRIPSVFNIDAALTSTTGYIDKYKSTVTSSSWATLYTYHGYNSPTDAEVTSLGSRAVADGVGAGQLEEIGATYLMLMRDLTLGMNTRWQQFTCAYININEAGATVVSDNGAQYYLIDERGSTGPTIISMGSRTKLLRQFFRYIKGSSTRVEATSDDVALTPVAFTGPTAGRTVVVVNSTGAKTFDIAGLPAGTYSITYTTSGNEQTITSQTIGAGGTLTSLTIPAAGALTVVGTPPTASGSSMAVSFTVYNKFKQGILDNGTNLRIDWDTDTVKVALLADTYTPNFDTHDFFDDVSAHEVSGTGYSAGGATLSSPVVTLDTANDRVDLDAADVSWPTSTITARYAIVYKSTGTPGTSPLALLVDFGANVQSVGTTFSIRWNGSGILRVA